MSRPTITLKWQRAPSEPSAIPASDVAREHFWFVWAPTELCPKKRHATSNGARVEAERLGALYREKEFLVYEATLIADDENGRTKPTAPEGDRNERG